MSQKRHTVDQIITKLRRADVLLGKGMKVPEVCKQLEIAEQTYYRWPHAVRASLRAQGVCKFPRLLHTLLARASLYIGGVWIRQPKELNMKRLLGLLLVMGMVGCGGGDEKLKQQIGSGVMQLLLTFGLSAGAWKLAGRRCEKRGVVKPSLRVTLWFFLRYVSIVTVFLIIIPSFLMESRQTFPIDASDLAYGAFVGLVSVLLFFTCIEINKKCPTQQSLFIIYISALVSLFVVLWFVAMFMGLLFAYD